MQRPSPKSMPNHDQQSALDYLRSAAAIRERCGAVFAAGVAGELEHFAVDLTRLPTVVDRVLSVTRSHYPTLDIPLHCRWNHFRAGGIDRVARLGIANLPDRERARALVDLVVVSVLLDAGAGETWRYLEDGHSYTRSEGLAVASLRMFAAGRFSTDPSHPWRADAEVLAQLSAQDLATGFQVTEDNRLIGLEGRVELLQRLGHRLREAPEFFGAQGRATGLIDYLAARSNPNGLPAGELLRVLLDALGPIWPGRMTLGEVNLGDVWRHPAAGGSGSSRGLVPFHKLSQWLAYSLVQPLALAGLPVVELDQLTGLPEYRNGGLFIDLGVLLAKHDGVTRQAHRPEGVVVVEWRALTVVLLDKVADALRRVLRLDATTLPLGKVLEGGTWSAGRAVARERRPDGRPPLTVDSDGTVF